ncbi:catalase [Ferruginibacter sp. HRS2-29]|uniref:catalase n=1 Tax=Ferruginibacter sp. HRS2-29 TaxID=2487334 RepID=UPI0020CD4A36|nr:catalase [Ferruginibacter sp. HRS2-29]MCP9750556.1 catalase [Ferruginibacter sp. HRS2-29]
MATKKNKQILSDKKADDLSPDIENAEGQFLTTNQGLRISDNQNSLKSGERGATLLEDFILREKITHFDHERIPERIVHARGSAAHGYFETYESQAHLTKAGFLQKRGQRTPVFVRFSTVAGSRGSTDLARDVRGFSVKFYTDEGNYDLVGNNMPVFFIQDAIKFPDLIHAVKPEPHNEMPQAASAHDTFWDFISLMPESMHMIMWAMSDRAIPRSLRMMEGFGVHTFRFINAEGRSSFIKFHWKPLLGVHSVAWDEATRISGKDPDFHRRDLWEAIESGAFPEWELGIQVVAEKDEHKFPFDLLDPTKLIPEEMVPVQRIGKMTLNRNPDNFFAETEQVAYHPGHLVPGIDFTNDPLLQGRLFSYTDTQLSRLGSANFHEIPINRSVNTVHNNQRDGHMRQQINSGKVAYEPNTLGGGCPFQAGRAAGGFSSFTERIDAKKIRGRSRSFFDHFSQATLFFNSQGEAEKAHLTDALRFELSKVQVPAIRERMVGLLTQVDKKLAADVADALGLKVPAGPMLPMNHSVPANENPKNFQPVKLTLPIEASPALSMENTRKDSIQTRQVAILTANGVNDAALAKMKDALLKAGAQCKLIAPKLGFIQGISGASLPVDQSFLIATSVVFDAVYVAGGEGCIQQLIAEPDALHFVEEAYKHCKPLAFEADARELAEYTYLHHKFDEETYDPTADGVIMPGKGNFPNDFINAIKQHRFWQREKAGKIPA